MTDVKLQRMIVLVIVGFLLLMPKITIGQSTVVERRTPSERCGLAQDYLRRIQKSRDLHARVDRLQAYQYIYQRLEVFIIRLEKNNQPYALELRTNLNQLAKTIDSFKEHYEEYDKSREAVVALKDCQNNMSEFQQRLDTARSLRQKVYDDVLIIQNLFSPEITGQLEVLHQELLATEKTGAHNE